MQRVLMVKGTFRYKMERMETQNKVKVRGTLSMKRQLRIAGVQGIIKVKGTLNYTRKKGLMHNTRQMFKERQAARKKD
jgi:hypothetical protein